MRLTKKQVEILSVIRKGNRDGSFPDLNEIIDRLSYSPSKESIQFSIRKLKNRNLVKKMKTEKRRGYFRRVICLTEEGYEIMKNRGL